MPRTLPFPSFTLGCFATLSPMLSSGKEASAVMPLTAQVEGRGYAELGADWWKWSSAQLIPRCISSVTLTKESPDIRRHPSIQPSCSRPLAVPVVRSTLVGYARPSIVPVDVKSPISPRKVSAAHAPGTFTLVV